MREEDNVTLFFRAIAISLCVAIIAVALIYGGWMYLTKDAVHEVYNPNVSVNIHEDIIKEPKGKTREELIKAWQGTGRPAHEDNVLNILLIGIDVDSKNMEINSRADAMVIVSINHNTKKITLASVLRDQYAYIESKKSFEKLHHANNYGGPKAQIEMIERYYKVSIDNYALVNFYSLPKIIDKLGGIKVGITKTEANYMNTYWGTDVKVGENRIDGATALIYMRIRHQTGGDTARVNRQQLVIKEIFKEMKTKSKAQMISLVTELFKYVRTGYTSNQMLDLATSALIEGWLNYDIVQLSFPLEEDRCEATIKNAWYWLVDYPASAKKMQEAFYNKSNIELSEERGMWL